MPDEMSRTPVGCKNPVTLQGHKSAEMIVTLDTSLVLLSRGCHEGTRRVRRLQARRAARQLTIVMCDKVGQDVRAMLLVQDRQPVGTLCAYDPNESAPPPRLLAERVRMISRPGLRDVSSNVLVDFWSGSRIKQGNGSGRSPRLHVSGGPLGHPLAFGVGVQPARCTPGLMSKLDRCRHLHL
jgi:hypothetical protein